MSDVSYPALKRREQAVILGVAVGVFLFAGGPIWRRFADWNAAIAWSYGLIPVLVLGWLLARRKLAFKPWALHTLEIGFVKFAITASILMAVMLGRGPAAPPRRTSEAAVDAITAAVGAPVQRVLVVARDPQGGSVSGVLRDAANAPTPGWVWLEGVDAARVAPPTAEPLQLVESGAGFEPSFDVLMVGQPLEIHSADRKLHTAQLGSQRETLFNVPVPAEGESPPRTVAEPGDARLRCTVHGAQERTAHLVIVDHPFFARADASGRFEIDQIPAGSYRLVGANADGSVRREAELTVHPSGHASQDVVLAGASPP